MGLPLLHGRQACDSRGQLCSRTVFTHNAAAAALLLQSCDVDPCNGQGWQCTKVNVYTVCTCPGGGCTPGTARTAPEEPTPGGQPSRPAAPASGATEELLQFVSEQAQAVNAELEAALEVSKRDQERLHAAWVPVRIRKAGLAARKAAMARAQALSLGYPMRPPACLACLACLQSDASLASYFDQWQDTFGRSYARGSSEYTRRVATFKQALQVRRLRSRARQAA